MEAKDRIIQGAIEVFQSKGVKFTMDDLATAIGASKRTVYEIVRSKEDVLLLVVNEVYDSIKRQELEILSDNTLDEITKLRKVIPVLPQSFNMIDYTRIYEIKKFYPKVYDEIIYRLDTGWKPTLDLINQCMDDGLIIRVDVSLIKSMVVGCITHLIDNDELYKSHSSYEESLNTVMDVIFNGLIIRK